MTTTALVVGLTAVLIGAIVQGSVGFGLNLLAAPVIALVYPHALPGSIILVALPLSFVVALRDREHRDAPALRWMLVGAIPGTVLGVLIATFASVNLLTLIVGVVTVLGVVLSLLPAELKVSSSTACGAGFASQTMGTAVGVGGPPVALLFQRHHGAMVRATLGHFFAFTGVLSVAGLLIAHNLTMPQARYAAALAPAMVVGLVVSGPLRHRLDVRWLRPTMLAMCALAGLMAIARGLTA
ncbi:MAG: sulfite exporter TauE/SafE family protein [Acidimicrobiia bacterium]